MRFSRPVGYIGLLAAIFSAVFLADIPNYMKYKKGDIKDFNTVEASELKKGDLVQGVIDMTYGCVADYEETETVLGIQTSKEVTKQYYSVVMDCGKEVIYETGNSEQLNSLELLTKQCEDYFEAVNEAYENYDEFRDDEPDLEMIEYPTKQIEFTGQVVDMNSELLGIVKEWYNDDEDFNANCASDIVIRYSEFSRFTWVVYAGIGAGVLAIVMLVLWIVLRKREKSIGMY
ncbi:MAG: hypothetical protein MJ071_02775 [Oscillospiraceae bacterium]|nr:hypothetical protein [Oscillospiraceae bacterium]